jgi:hypothetical protein
MDFKPDSLDAVECSSVLAMGSSEAAALIMKASSAVKVGGLLWFKVDGACFSSGFENALHQAGFSLILPSNTRLAVNECCDEGDKERVADALRTAHFIFAVKTRAVENVILNPTELTFTRTATTDEQLEKLKDYVRALRAARDDPTLVSVAQEFLALAATASNEAITQSPRVWLACLWANAKALYPTKVLPQFPSDKRNDSTALKAWVEKLQKLLDEDERILASLKRDDVGNFVSLCHRACTRLSSIVADMR